MTFGWSTIKFKVVLRSLRYATLINLRWLLSHELIRRESFHAIERHHLARQMHTDAGVLSSAGIEVNHC